LELLKLVRRLAVVVVFLIPACGTFDPLPAVLVSKAKVQFATTAGGPLPPDQTVTMTGADGLWLGEATWTATSSQPWLSVSPSSGTIRSGQKIPLTLHVSSQGDQWTGATSTVGAPATGLGVWTGSAFLVWTGDSTLPGKFYDPVSDTWFGSTSIVGAPSTRLPTPVVWTGTEMIVWGGVTFWGGTPLDTGARYNPSTDTWTPMSTVGAPAPRFSHTAIWTGTHLIVWGGDSGGYSYKNTGGIYDPATDTWIGATTLTNAPSPRGNAAAVWTGTRMIIWGGENPSKFDTGYYYDPVADAWTGTTTTVGAPAARSHMPGVWTGQEMIIWGGGSGGPHLNTGARYNPATDTWTGQLPLAGAPAGRATLAAVWTGSDMIVWGGEINGTLTNTGGIYRPPSPLVGIQSAVVTITPDQGKPTTITVQLTVTP
jgi:BACON domain-containing protein